MCINPFRFAGARPSGPASRILAPDVARVRQPVTGRTVALEWFLSLLEGIDGTILACIPGLPVTSARRPIKKNSGAIDRKETHLTRSLSRLLKAIQNPGPASRKRSRLTDLQVIRTALGQCIEDCQGIAIDRLSLRIASARTHQELWLLRSDAYRLISLSHCQSVASQRISALLQHFEGWISIHEVRRGL
jgi:hypothetical protein